MTEYDITGKTILVTGAAGFIGSHFVEEAVPRFPETNFVVVDLLTPHAGRLENLAPVREMDNFRFIQGDICDIALMDRLVKNCDVVVNFAAESLVDFSVRDAEQFIRTNIEGVYRMVRLGMKHSIDFFLQISTDEVYGENLGEPSEEDAPFCPTNPYSVTKAAAERMIFAEDRAFGFPYKIVRMCNNFGPRENVHNAIPVFTRMAIQENRMPVYGDGTQIREWMFVKDAVEAIILVLLDGEIGEVYNIGTGLRIQNIELARRIARILAKDESVIEFVPDRPGHDARYAIDSSKIRKSLGWEPRYSFDEALEKTVLWFASNLDAIQPSGFSRR